MSAMPSTGSMSRSCRRTGSTAARIHRSGVAGSRGCHCRCGNSGAVGRQCSALAIFKPAPVKSLFALDPEPSARQWTSAIAASAVALGAAIFNARVAAAAHQVLGPANFTEAAPRCAAARPRCISVMAPIQQLAALYDAMLAREANRRLGTARPIADGTMRILQDAAEHGGARLHVLTDSDDIARAATIIAASDRARYLTPGLHSEMIAEMRWPGDPLPDTGIDIRSLEFAPGELAVVDILRRPDVMDHLARWNAGSALGEGTRRHVAASSAVAVISVPGGSLTDYARRRVGRGGGMDHRAATRIGRAAHVADFSLCPRSGTISISRRRLSAPN